MSRLENHRAALLLRRQINSDAVSLQQVFDQDALVHLLAHLGNADYPHLNVDAAHQLEACWCIANVCAGDRMFVQSLADKGLFALLPRILESPFDKVCEQGVWAVGNIAAEEAAFKELLLDASVLEPLARRLRAAQDPHTLQFTCWAFCNLVCGAAIHSKPHLVPAALDALLHVLLREADVEVLSQVLHALASLKCPALLPMLIGRGGLRRLVELTAFKAKPLLHPLLQVLVVVSEGDSRQVQLFVDAGGLGRLFGLLGDAGLDVYSRKETLWILSNVVVGDPAHMQLVVLDDPKLDLLFRHAAHENAKVRKEAFWCLCNATKHQYEEATDRLVQRGLLRLAANWLQHNEDLKLVRVVLDTLAHVLRCSRKHHAEMECCGLVDAIEDLQLHPSHAVYKTVCALIEEHFEVLDWFE